MKEKLTPFQRRERLHGLIFGKKPKRHPFNFEIHLNDDCNLSCKGCFHFAPLVKGHVPYPLDEFEKDIKRISELFHGKFGWVHLLGGEPLLNKDVTKYLDVVGRYIKKGQVDLITNGLLLPKMGEDFFDSCKRNHIRIAITKYPIPFNYEATLSSVLEKGCQAYFFGDRGLPEAFSMPALNKDSMVSAKRNYIHCVLANACVTLDHGRLTYCSIPGYVRIYNETFGKTFETEDDWISIHDHKKREILDFLRNPHSFCKYCDLQKRLENPIPWAQSKREKEEWLYP